jgi:hypothetical protein
MHTIFIKCRSGRKAAHHLLAKIEKVNMKEEKETIVT